LTRFGWASVFLAGGVLPIMLLPFALAVLRDEADCEESSIRTRHRKTAPLHGIGVPSTGQQTARLSNLWRAPFATTTLLIWAIAFFVFLVTYQFIFWIPTLLVSYGFSPASAALGSSACAIGGILANVALLPLVGRFGMHRLLIATACLAIACIGALSLGVVDRALVLWLIGGIGAGITSGCVGQSTLAILAYPERLRTAGVGFAAAAGRVGAIVGPGLGGALLSMNIPAQRIITLCCIPIVLVVVFLESARRSTPRG
jgi:AAHS family 4-hydroxybenzoate transporter-like MFS transporter